LISPEEIVPIMAAWQLRYALRSTLPPPASRLANEKISAAMSAYNIIFSKLFLTGY
jgi:hypothetical protein